MSDKKKQQAELARALYGIKPDKFAEAEKKTHEFWSTQPVPQFGSPKSPETSGPIEPPKDPEDVRATPLKLPADFEWVELDVTDSGTLDEVYELLFRNYVEDDDNMFRFDYSRDFIKWALLAPGHRRDWHIGIRVKSTGKLVASITGIPVTVVVRGTELPAAEINFLCIHKKLRTKRLAPVLIREITRRINRCNIWQAVYTSGTVLPKPIVKNRYYHRSLNPKKLIETSFSHLPANTTMASVIKMYRLPSQTLVKGIRPLEKKDVLAAHALLINFLSKYDLYVHFSVEEFEHWFMPRENVIDTFVVEDPDSGEITDLVSFYTLASSVIGHPKHETVKAAYSFYNVSTKTSWKNLMNDTLILAKQRDFDVFNALDLMENKKSFIDELKFGMGDGHLQYYLFNWSCPDIPSQRNGLVLL